MPIAESPPNGSAPLAGIKVLDLSRILAGPWATQILADLGADVVKVERPGGGDDTRHWGPPYVNDVETGEARYSAYFLAANRGKRSIVLDLKRPSHLAVLTELLSTADILVENFKPGFLESTGLNESRIRSLNPDIILCSVSSFGPNSPYCNRPGYDAMIQAMGGLMSITGNPDAQSQGKPVKVGVAVADLFAGLFAVIGVLASLVNRQGNGMGTDINVSLFDTQIFMLANQAMNYLVSGVVPRKMGTAHPNIVPYQAFEASDGGFMLAVGNDEQFRRLCVLLDRVELGVDGRFSSNTSRVSHRKELIGILEEHFLRHPKKYWMDRLHRVGIPCGPIQSLDQLAADPHVRSEGLFYTVRDETGIELPQVANPIVLNETRIGSPLHPPRLGEGTRYILTNWLGWTSESVADWMTETVHLGSKQTK